MLQIILPEGSLYCPPSVAQKIPFGFTILPPGHYFTKLNPVFLPELWEKVRVTFFPQLW